MNQKKLSLILFVTLFLSLSGNFFMFGLLSANKDMPPQPPAHNIHNPAHADQNLRKQLSEQDRAIIKSEFEQYEPLIAEIKADQKAAQAALREAMQADPVDTDAADNAIQQLRSLHNEMFYLMQEIRSAASEQLSPQGRRAMLSVTQQFANSGSE